MNAPSASRQGSPFSRFTVLGVILVGFAAFLAMLYFIGAGDTGGRGNDTSAHASANGLNGYAGFVRLLENEGYEITLSRQPSGLETNDLLVLTPNLYSDAEDIGQILENREYVGPTLVILPKWFAGRPRKIPDDMEDEFKDGWVELGMATQLAWAGELEAPYRISHKIEELEEDDLQSWNGMELSGELPTRTIAYAEENALHEPLVTDAGGHTLAFTVLGEEGTDYYDDAHWTVFVVEPDLVNNYGMADAERAKLALALIQEVGYGDTASITFDLTLNGYGGAMNLLTLAFQPPFLAATLCLLLAILIIGWRAFLRFGPAAAGGQAAAFGKKQLVRNGAGLIVRAGRLGLLAKPYAALSEKRLGRVLGLARPDAETIDAAMAVRLPHEEPFSARAARLQSANTPSEILRAAQALKELEGKLAQ